MIEQFAHHHEGTPTESRIIPTTAEILGLPPTAVLVESRLPSIDNDGYGTLIANNPHRLSSDGVEALIDPSVTHAIVPEGLDPDFLEYARRQTGNREIMTIPVDPTQLTFERIREAASISGGMYYGMWPVEGLSQDRQVIDSSFQERANAKGWLERWVPQEYLPPRLLISPDSAEQDIPTLASLTESDIMQVQGDEEIFWAKAANWGMSSVGVKACQSIEDIHEFAQTLSEMGVTDQIILERHMPGAGWTFTMARDTLGNTRLVTLTDQLSNSQGQRIGNIIYDESLATPEMRGLLDTVEGLIQHHPEFQGHPGFYVFDMVRDRDGRSYINDPAQRKSGTTPTSLLRQHWTAEHNIKPADVFAGQVSLYLKPGVSFKETLKLLGEYGEFHDNRQAIVRVHYDAYGTTSVKLALLSAEGRPEACDEMKSVIQQKFTDAGVLAGTLA